MRYPRAGGRVWSDDGGASEDDAHTSTYDSSDTSTGANPRAGTWTLAPPAPTVAPAAAPVATSPSGGADTPPLFPRTPACASCAVTLPTLSRCRCTHGIPCISPETLARYLTRGANDELPDPEMKVVVVDCRFEYEYRAGHIRGALSAPTTLAIDYLFYGAEPVTFLERRRAASLPLSHPKVMLVFHCEFSSHRAPTLAKYLRGLDRSINQHPNLIYPNVFILHGGYECFYRTIKLQVGAGLSEGGDDESASSSNEGIFERPASVPPPSRSPAIGPDTSSPASVRSFSMTSASSRRALKMSAPASTTMRGGGVDDESEGDDEEDGEDEEDEEASFVGSWDLDLLFDPCPPVYVKMDDRRYVAEKKRGLARIRKRAVFRRTLSSGDVAAFAYRTTNMSASAASSLDVEIAAQERWLLEAQHHLRLEVQRLSSEHHTPDNAAAIARLKREIDLVHRTRADQLAGQARTFHERQDLR